MSLEFYILRGGQKEGPLTEEEILDSLDFGDIEGSDWCIESASGEKRRVSDVFQIVGSKVPRRRELPKSPAPRDVEDHLPEIGYAPEVEKPPTAPQPKVSKPPKRELIYFGHPSIITYWKSLLLAAAIAAGGYFGSSLNGYLGVAGWLWASLTIVYVLVARAMSDYVVTSVRVEVIKGLVSKSSSEVRIDDIRAINVKTSGLLGLIGIGTVEFASAGTDIVDVAFFDVGRAHRVKALVRRLQDEREQARKA